MKRASTSLKSMLVLHLLWIKKKRGTGVEEKKRDGPGKEKGTVLGEEREGRSLEKEKRTSNTKNEKAFSYIKPKSTTKNRAKITIKVNNSSI